jgi:hypothetical protein
VYRGFLIFSQPLTVAYVPVFLFATTALQKVRDLVVMRQRCRPGSIIVSRGSIR